MKGKIFFVMGVLFFRKMPVNPFMKQATAHWYEYEDALLSYTEYRPSGNL